LKELNPNGDNKNKDKYETKNVLNKNISIDNSMKRISLKPDTNPRSSIKEDTHAVKFVNFDTTSKKNENEFPKPKRYLSNVQGATKSTLKTTSYTIKTVKELNALDLTQKLLPIVAKEKNELDPILSENNKDGGNDEEFIERVDRNNRKPNKKSTKKDQLAILNESDDMTEKILQKAQEEALNNVLNIDKPTYLNNLNDSNFDMSTLYMGSSIKTKEFNQSQYHYNLKNIEKSLSLLNQTLNPNHLPIINKSKSVTRLNTNNIMQSPAPNTDRNGFNNSNNINAENTSNIIKGNFDYDTPKQSPRSPEKSVIEEILPILNVVENCKEEFSYGSQMKKDIAKMVKKNEKVSKTRGDYKRVSFRRDPKMEPEKYRLKHPGYFQYKKNSIIGIGKYRTKEDLGKLTRLEVFETVGKMKFDKLMIFKEIMADGMHYTKKEKEIFGIKEKPVQNFRDKHYADKIQKLMKERDDSHRRFDENYSKIQKSIFISKLGENERSNGNKGGNNENLLSDEDFKGKSLFY